MTGIERLLRIGPRWPRPNWLDSEHYLTVHYSHMQDLERQLGITDGLSIIDAFPSLLVIEGDITWPANENGCFPKLVVQKQLTRADDNQLQGRTYAYQACVNSARHAYEVFRYDNVHSHPGHADSYHAHWLLDGVNETHWIGLHHWPHLSDVIVCLDEWWKDDGQHRVWL